ncbi:hypothetical protein, conserved [Leishmania donovani]|uniref:Uncharacterized protein n=2 Tax=Leishmania donovani TaxID=5661 RepID=E9BS26_LEIDO|nr:hypothetical protein, conserved [Leishmania donovani]CBZ38055.1 hypothetical protein, conserved [Leishmania donovani]
MRARANYTVMYTANCCVAARRCSVVLVLCAVLFAACGLSLVAEPPKHTAEDMDSRGSSSSRSECDGYRRQDHPLHPFCGVEFAESYTVAIATTMPLENLPPMTQIGQLYVDRVADAARVDQVYRGQRTSFLLDNRHLRGFFFFDTPSGAAAAQARNGKDGDDEGPRQRCHVFYLTHKVAPFCVPRRYTASSRESVVRGVPVTRFSGTERYDHTPLVEQSFYVLNATDAGAAVPRAIPWRLELSARSDLELSKITEASYEPPNWRFFGHPMFDELVLSTGQESHLQLWKAAYDLLTVDFYNYYPTKLRPDVFAVPPQCTAVLRKGTSTGSGAAEEASALARDRTASSALTEPLLELATIELFLLPWHVLQNASVGWHAAKKVDGQ